MLNIRGIDGPISDRRATWKAFGGMWPPTIARMEPRLIVGGVEFEESYIADIARIWIVVWESLDGTIVVYRSVPLCVDRIILPLEILQKLVKV